MASKPWRSWGKTYTQGWNMAFNIGSGVGSSSISHHAQGANTSGFNGSKNNSNGRDWKDSCCWRYNKNRCKRSSTECLYDHRCTFCTGWNHSFYNCRKRKTKFNPINLILLTMGTGSSHITHLKGLVVLLNRIKNEWHLCKIYNLKVL